MKIKVKEWERNACRIRSELPFSGAKQRRSETRGSEMSVIQYYHDYSMYRIMNENRYM